MSSGSQLLDVAGRLMLSDTGARLISNGEGDECCCGNDDPDPGYDPCEDDCDSLPSSLSVEWHYWDSFLEQVVSSTYTVHRVPGAGCSYNVSGTVGGAYPRVFMGGCPTTNIWTVMFDNSGGKTYGKVPEEDPSPFGRYELKPFEDINHWVIVS